MLDQLLTPKPLRFWHGLVGMVWVVFGGVFMIILLAALTMLGVPLDNWAGMLLQTMLSALLFVGATSMVLTKLHQPIGETTGIRKAPRWAWLAALIGVWPMGVLSDQLMVLAHNWQPDRFSAQPLTLLQDVFVQAPLGGFILITLAISILPAIGEELMFRGLVLRSFRADMPAHFAVIYSAALFGLVHMGWLQGMAALLFGLFLAIVTLRSGSILPAMASHFINNLTFCIFARTAGTDAPSIYETGYDHLTLLLAGGLLIISLGLLFKGKTVQSS